jgi:hypothetical protein
MNTPEEAWTTRLHAAVDEHPAALAFDVPSYVAAGRKRARRNRAAALVATAAAVAVVGAVAAVATSGTGNRSPEPAGPIVPGPPTTGPDANGWVAIDADQGGGDIYLIPPGQDARRLEIAGSDTLSEACPTWSPDGTRLLLGRVTGSSESTASNPELVVVPIGRDGAAGVLTVIGVDGFSPSNGFDPHPCGIWAPDGRWVAFGGASDVWVVDTQTSAIRRLPDLRPSDLEWRPGTDELAIAGDLGLDRAARIESTPVTLYSVSTGEVRQLGSVEASHITWSPDGATLAYKGPDEPDASRELRLVDADGTHDRVLVSDAGPVNHGIGPVWSPAGDRIAYQRLDDGNSSEAHVVVLVNVSDGTETVIEPPEVDGRAWYPTTVSWSPDGTTLLYSAWTEESGSWSVLAVPANFPRDARVLTEAGAIATGPVPYYSHRWAPTQMWGGQPK